MALGKGIKENVFFIWYLSKMFQYASHDNILKKYFQTLLQGYPKLWIKQKSSLL